MPSDIPALGAAYATAPAAVAKPVAAATNGVTAAASPLASLPQPNLRSLLDPSTGLVVLEFYNAKGQEVASLPTRKQLDLYRINGTSDDVFHPAIGAAPTSGEAAKRALSTEA